MFPPKKHRAVREIIGQQLSAPQGGRPVSQGGLSAPSGDSVIGLRLRKGTESLGQGLT